MVGEDFLNLSEQNRIKKISPLVHKVLNAPYILILQRKGKRKTYYTVHQLDNNNEYLRIFGKFSSLKKAQERAREIAQAIFIRYGFEPKIIYGKEV